MSDDLTIVIFGGTGSIGTLLTEGLLKGNSTQIILVSNNEQELWMAKNRFKLNGVKYEFCDIRDKEGINKVFLKHFPDTVINCSALKHVNYCENFPINAVKTNILGVENLLSVANEKGVKRFLQMSTDKAVEPLGVMGASKLIAERLCVQWNGIGNMSVSCVRLGNVLGSRGSLLPQVKHDIEKYGKVFITDRDMMRFFITKDEVWLFVKNVLEYMKGGEIFIPKLKEAYIIDMITEITRQYERVIEIVSIGKSKGERLREKLFSEYEKVKDLKWCYEIENISDK